MIKSKILLTLLLGYSVASFAAEADLEAQKKKIAAHADQRIANIQTFKSCVQASATKDALKACKKANKEKNKAMKESRKKK